MKYRTLDKNGDYTLGARQFLTGREAVAQAIRTRMYLLLAEWWENLEDGLPLFERILGTYGGDDIRAPVDLIIGERIQGTLNVTELLEYESVYDMAARNYSATCSVNTVFGEMYLSLSNNLHNVEVRY
jgi:hypothetical protein